MKFLQIVFSIIALFLWVLPNNTLANSVGNNQFINIVNPIRMSSYTKDPVSTINSEYEEIKKRNLSATWLLTYEVLNNNDLVSVVKGMDKNQELGIFLEITPQFAEQAGVIYNKTDFWHRANSLFLSGYTQTDRKKLIDTVFKKFKEAFGFYPTSVGSWWTDSFSLEYMKNKYAITANLTCADQFETDGYHIWGQYWSVPFYPSKYHAGIPAKDKDSKLDLVTIQWAPRDPLNGYRSSLYSTQDYFTQGLNIDYYEKLLRLYAESHKNKFGQITLGLEGDFSADTYKGIYARQIQLISELKDSGKFQVSTMQQFSEWYRSQFKNGTPDYFIESDDLLNNDQKSIWYQSPNYRVGMIYSGKESKLTIIDLRTYFRNLREPYYLSPNFQIDLFINIPSVIDNVSNPQSKWEIQKLKLRSIEKIEEGYTLNFEDNNVIKLTEESINFDNFRQLEQPIFVKNSPKLEIRKTGNSFTISPKSDFPYQDNGLIFSDLSIEATYFLWRPKIRLVGQVLFVSLAVAVFVIMFFIKIKRSAKLKLLLVLFLSFLIGCAILYLTNSQTYLVNQAEIDALDHLAALPNGKIVVVDNGCLICRWQTKYPPPAFAAKKDYVSRLSRKPIVYNATIFQAKTRKEGRQELNKLGAKYIYLVRYEGYLEEMPFSPGDLNVEKIYENANTQIWQVKKT